MYKIYKDKYLVYDDGRIYNTILKRFIKQTLTGRGYRTVKILGKNARLHRVIAEVFLPNYYNKPTVDHKDRNKENNSLYNLRWASQKEQIVNTGIRSTNTSGTKGVCYHKRDKLWVAHLCVDGKLYRRSSKTIEEAILKRIELERKYLNK